MIPEVTVSILTYTRLDLAKACITAIMNCGEPVNLILTANGNPQAAKYFTELAERFAGIKVVVNESNHGFWKPNNHALTLVETRWMLLCNDDVIAPKNFLAALKQPFLNDPRAVFSCPDGGCSELNYDFNGKIGRKEYCEGALLLVDAAIAKKHGLFEELPGMAYGEDSHASLRFRELGYNLHWVNLRIQHARAATSRSVPEVAKWMQLNHAHLRKRWNHYLKPHVRKMDYPILIRRRHAYGDTLLITPIIRALKEQKPLSPILVETSCADVLIGNSHITLINTIVNPTPDCLVIDLNMAYENSINTHIVDAYARVAELTHYDKKTEVFFPELRNNTREYQDFVAIHVGPTSWKSKNWSPDCWRSLIDKLGMKTILVGHSDGTPIPATVDARNKTTIPQMAAIIAQCKLLITVDSLPLHLAQAVGTPVCGLFGVTDPKFILTDGSPSVGVHGNEVSFGMRHRRTGQVAVDDYGMAMKSITVEMVLDAVEKMDVKEKAVA